MMLERSTRDFQSLIDRMEVQKAFENAKKDGDRYKLPYMYMYLQSPR